MVIGVLHDDRQVNVAEPSPPEIPVYLPQITPGTMIYEVAARNRCIGMKTTSAPTTMVTMWAIDQPLTGDLELIGRNVERALFVGPFLRPVQLLVIGSPLPVGGSPGTG